MIAARWALWWTTLAVVLALDRPGVEPRVGVLATAVLALAAACALFAALARLRIRPLLPPPGRRATAARLTLHFTGRAAFEEALWRGLVLAPCSAALGPAPALALSTGGFAASHVGTQGRRAASHVLTGATFGAVYLMTGHLLGAVLAHATYDLLVTVAVLAQKPCPVRPMVGGGRPPYDHVTEAAR